MVSEGCTFHLRINKVKPSTNQCPTKWEDIVKVQTNLCIGNYVLPCDVYTTYWDPSIPNPRPLSPYPCPISWVECSLLCDPISIVEAIEESDRHDPFEGKSRANREANMELYWYIEIMLWFPPLPTNSSDEVVEDLLGNVRRNDRLTTNVCTVELWQQAFIPKWVISYRWYIMITVSLNNGKVVAAFLECLYYIFDK